MERILLLFCFSISFCFSQNVKGKIMADSLPISNVEVINITKKEVIKANKDGSFQINASIKNWISFYHKDYDVVKIYIDSLFDYSKSLEIVLIRKSEKIEEIVVKKANPYFKDVNKGMSVAPVKSNAYGFSDGTAYTGVNLMAVGKMLFGLFKNKDKEMLKKREPIQFLTFVRRSYNDDFLAKSLNLEPNEIDSFLSFCNFDEKSKEIVESYDEMVLLQFLMTKSEEYKKLHQKE